MRWMGGRESDQVEDQRGIGPGHIAGGGIGVVVLAIVIGLLTGHSPLQILQLLTSSSPSASTETRAAEPGPGGTAAPEDDDKKFVRVILADTEDTWKQVFQEHGRQYRLPNLVLSTNRFPPHADGLGRGRAVLLSRRREGVPRPPSSGSSLSGSAPRVISRAPT